MSMYPGEYDGNSLLVDQIEEAVLFAVDKLFLHYEIYHFVSFFNHVLELVGERLQDSQELPTLSQALKEFENCLPLYSTKMTPHNFSEAVEYVKETIFQHFHLYQFLLTQEQPKDLTVLNLPIEVLPTDPTPLVQGTEEGEWNRREMIAQLEAEHGQKEREVIESYTKSQGELKDKLEEAYQTELAKIEDKLTTPDEVARVIESLVATHMELMTLTVEHSLQRHTLALETKLERMEMLSSQPSKQSLMSLSPVKGTLSSVGEKSRSSSKVSVTANKH